MRHSSVRGALASLLLTLVVIAAGCVVPHPPGSAPPAVQVLPADARALAYGRSAGEILDNPQIQDKVRALFQADWVPPVPGTTGKLTLAAPQYFERGGPVRMVRIADADYISVTGCAAQLCPSRRGLLLVREGGEVLMGRLDEGGFSHHYAYGPGMVAGSPGTGIVLEATVRALEDASGGSAFPRPAP
jgi:hypothetical protein